MQQMERPSFSCWVACSLSSQGSLLVLILAQASCFETLIEALLLVPSWVGCCRGITPPLFNLAKVPSSYFLRFIPFIVCFSEKHSHAQTVQGQPVPRNTWLF